MRYIIGAALLALSGCTTFSDIEAGLGALEGRRIESAFSALGYPDDTIQVGRDTAYVWGNRQSFNLAVPTSETAYGTVGGRTFSATTYGTSYQQVNYQCDIKVVANSSGMIKAWDYFGNVGGCSRYSTRLRQVAEKSELKLKAPSKPAVPNKPIDPLKTNDDKAGNSAPRHY